MNSLSTMIILDTDFNNQKIYTIVFLDITA